MARLPAALAILAGVGLAACATTDSPRAAPPGVAPDVYPLEVADDPVEDIDSSDFDALTEG